MPRIIAVANQKGGVGKTTTSVNLCASLWRYGHQSLLIDLDPQGNATTGVGADETAMQASVLDWLLGKADLKSIVKRRPGPLDVVPCNRNLISAEVELLGVERREARLRDCLRHAPPMPTYDYVILDCPPSLNILTLNALVAADSLLVPMQCEYYAMEGLAALLGTVDQVRRRANPRLAIEGVLRTMYDPRNSLTREVSRQLIEHFGDKVFRTVIPRNVRLAEAPSHGLPVILYDRHCRGAVAYMALADELTKIAPPPNRPV